MPLYTFPKLNPYLTLQIVWKMKSSIQPLITRNIIDYGEYKIRKLAEPTSAKELKGVHLNLIEELDLEIDSAMFVAATLTSIKGSQLYPLLGS